MEDKTVYQGRALILTALSVEYQAVRTHLSGIHEETIRGTVYKRGTFTAGQWSWDVLVAEIGPGNANAAAEAQKAIIYFDPEVMLFIGIAGGVKDVDIGDVVVATRIYGYESGKVSQEGFLARPDVGMSNYRLVQRARSEAGKQGWLKRIRGRYPSTEKAPRVFVGPIAAGERVLSTTKSELYAFLRSHYNDTFAVEMEGRGFLQAAYISEPVQALVIRGISDKLDGKSEGNEEARQLIASRNAAAFAFELLAQLDVPANARPVQSSKNDISPAQQAGGNRLQGYSPTVPTSSNAASGVGSVQPQSAAPASPVLIYYSFAPVDETLVRQFQNQMKPLKDSIIEWDRTKVIAGRITRIEVDRHLDEAGIILLFVSADFMANKDCMYEMQRALARQGSVSIVPIILRPVAFLNRTEIGHLKRYPENDKTVADWGNRRADIFAKIAQEIGYIISPMPPV